MTQAEQDFLAEYTRKLLVLWADHCLREGSLPTGDPAQVAHLHLFPVYLEYAVNRGWVSKGTSPRVLAKGFKAAAAFLRR